MIFKKKNDIIFIYIKVKEVIVIAHPVKCAVCGQTFDRDKIQATKYGARRYAHQACFPDGELVPLVVKELDEDLVKLDDYIRKLLGENYNPARVKKQIKDFKDEYGYSYSGMLKSLVYFYEVKGNSKDKANGGIGIVPFVYQDAYRYYYDMWQAKVRNENKNVDSYTKKIKEITIKVPQIISKIKLFNLDEEE